MAESVLGFIDNFASQSLTKLTIEKSTLSAFSYQ
jgi:hypothetical protein